MLKIYRRIFFPDVSSRPSFLGWEIKNKISNVFLSLLMLFEIVTPPFCKFVMSFSAHRFARVSVLHAVIGRHLVFIHLIAGGLISRLGAHTPQVNPTLTTYTLLCMQSYAPSCDWWSPGAVHLLSTLPRTLISTNRPIKGIINIKQNLKVISKGNYCC